MNEIEFELNKENREKKAIGSNAFKRAGGRGGKCRFPSDYLTKKQKEGLNGMVETVKMNEPMTWEGFKSLSQSLQKEYLSGLIANYEARQCDIAQMFGVSNTLMNRTFKEIAPNISFRTTGKRKPSEKWLKFIGIEAPKTVGDMLCEAKDWCDKDEAKVDVDPVAEIRKEAEELGITVRRDVPTVEGELTFTGLPAHIFNRISYVLNRDKVHEMTIIFKEIE